MSSSECRRERASEAVPSVARFDAIESYHGPRRVKMRLGMCSARGADGATSR
jgi:hypothetical protein